VQDPFEGVILKYGYQRFAVNESQFEFGYASRSVAAGGSKSGLSNWKQRTHAENHLRLCALMLYKNPERFSPLCQERHGFGMIRKKKYAEALFGMRGSGIAQDFFIKEEPS